MLVRLWDPVLLLLLLPILLLSLLQESMKEADTDNDGAVSFGELAALMHKLKKDPNSGTNALVRKIHKAPAQVRREW